MSPSNFEPGDYVVLTGGPWEGKMGRVAKNNGGAIRAGFTGVRFSVFDAQVFPIRTDWLERVEARYCPECLIEKGPRRGE